MQYHLQQLSSCGVLISIDNKYALWTIKKHEKKQEQHKTEFSIAFIACWLYV